MFPPLSSLMLSKLSDAALKLLMFLSSFAVGLISQRPSPRTFLGCISKPPLRPHHESMSIVGVLNFEKMERFTNMMWPQGNPRVREINLGMLSGSGTWIDRVIAKEGELMSSGHVMLGEDIEVVNGMSVCVQFCNFDMQMVYNIANYKGMAFATTPPNPECLKN
ncbi:hypothetical protein IFM89_018965 [Coptis chinensis]|uniref:Uncharacterized protein n=1 Tax=Coptis chinensis TaxID=261450 RepID=A0A835LW95_9MAGN|nr:hypothetical protein IFM89_018965 [Coptis chinensis]